MVRTLLLVSLALLAALPAAAQEYGDGFGVGGVFLPDGAGAIIVKTRLGREIGLEASASLNTFSDDDVDATYVMFAAGVQRYWNTDDRLQPYFGGRAAVRHWSGDAEGVRADVDETKFGFIAVLGAEYFVSRRLSVEGEAGVGLYFGSFELSTGTRLAAFLYL